LDDDSVPYVPLTTTTGLFAAAFGCPLHQFEGSQVAARPIVFSPQEADRLPIPDLDIPPISRFFELAELIREQVGPEVPISVPDIQSPFDIAALIWSKEHFYEALVEHPDAVLRLVEKCHILLKNFLVEFKRRFGEVKRLSGKHTNLDGKRRSSLVPKSERMARFTAQYSLS
jgi:uroporphyrinogen-III decarboxylase